ncbi:MAG: sporulation protein YunB [Bacillota bacterium]|nr:sporulation protein YunB [Bacillota bacterium]
MIKNKLRFKLVLFIFLLLIMANVLLYSLDKVIAPTVMMVATSEMQARALETVNIAMVNEFSKDFNYDDIVKVEKDNEGNIVMMKADTVKMNKIACDVSINAQNKLQSFGSMGIKIPLAYIFKNNILASFGPTVTVKMQPIGSIETKYISDFESAGINQTRHKIYVQVKTNVRIIIPFKSTDIEVQNEMPIAETIIVGKIPNNAIGLNLQDAGFKVNEKNDSKK